MPLKPLFPIIPLSITIPYISVGVVALASGGMVYLNPLGAYMPGFIPGSLIGPIQAALGSLLGNYALEMGGMASAPPFNKTMKERLILSSFIACFAAGFIGPSLLGDATREAMALGAIAGVVGTVFLPESMHIIK